jgi:YHS domain-containing protein
MMTIELFVTEVTGRTRELAEALLFELITEESAPAEVMEGTRALTHVVVHQPAVWVTGGPAAPRYLVRVTVPGSWHTKQFGAYVVPRITEIIGRFEDDPGRLTEQPHCVVQIVGLKEHSMGTLGRVTTSTDITRLITENYRGGQQQGLDPVCGMTVDLATATLTLEYEGTAYAFCAPACRRVFAEDHGLPV